jgi:hypothetical protein
LNMLWLPPSIPIAQFIIHSHFNTITYALEKVPKINHETNIFSFILFFFLYLYFSFLSTMPRDVLRHKGKTPCIQLWYKMGVKYQ